MNRRDALKNLTMGLGYTVAAPTIFNMLASCTAETENWNPMFLSIDEKYMVTHLIDIILPKTDTPGALDLNVPQFLDMMYFEIENKVNQDLFKNGATLFAEKFASTYNPIILEGKKSDFEKLLSSYFTMPEEVVDLVLQEQKLRPEQVNEDALERYTMYKFLLSVRYYAMFGYCTSEKVGEEILAYDPIPGVYSACITVEEATGGKAWSL
ncbi:gluconate 2-dehydrogenase subunit 3 family protein [Mariniflexile sp.]|uniref:gluconate 2-dehydrogenase subunit 3 family protein n=3 Tax=Mariniflexile sp. TaxID=1979402 RepID=UPI00404783DC